MQKISNLDSPALPAIPERLVNLDEVEKITGFKSSYIYSKIGKSEFPKPIKIGTASRWRESEVQAWIFNHIEGSTYKTKTE